MKEALKLAIEGGYGGVSHKLGWTGSRTSGFENYRGDILIDPLFWSSLGKALGWDKRVTEYYSFTDGKINNEVWRIEFHRFIDHLAEGGTPDDFFKSLIDNK